MLVGEMFGAKAFTVWCPLCASRITFAVAPVPVVWEVIGGRRRWSGRVEWPPELFIRCLCGVELRVEIVESAQTSDAIITGVALNLAG